MRSNNFLQKLQVNNQFNLAIRCVLIGVLGRLIPHLPNVTPMTSLSLFTGAKLHRVKALVTLCFTLILSDAMLAYFYGYPVFSLWTIFSYSGFIGIVFLGQKLQSNKTKSSQKFLLCWLGSATFGYWLWTNFGVWLTSNLYVKNLSGLLECYFMALPFLRNALIGDVIWGVLIFGAFSWVSQRKNKCASGIVLGK